MSILYYKSIIKSTSDDSVRTKIRESMVFAMNEQICVAKGYNYDIGDIFEDYRSFEQISRYPAVNIVAGPEQYLNPKPGEHAIGNLNKIMKVKLDCFINESGNMQLAQDRVLADIEKLFMTRPYYHMVDAQDNSRHWARACMFESARPYTLESGIPNGGIEIIMNVYYATIINNPKVPT